MTFDLIVRGDHLPILVPLACRQATGLDSPGALVWGLDLMHATSRRAAHKQLRRECTDLMKVAAVHPGLACLFVVYTHGRCLPQGSCLSAAAQVAKRLHTEMERAQGRFVEVIVIDATGWEDGEVLRDRITQTVAAPAAGAGNVALGWHAITDATIHHAAMTQAG